MGYIKSYIWLSVCLASTITGFIFTNTVRVFVYMLVMTIIRRKQYDEPLFACDTKLGMRLELVGDKTYLDKLLLLRSQPEYHPLNYDHLVKIRAKKEEKLLRVFVLDLTVIVMVYFLIFFNIMNSWSHDSYYITHHLKNVIEHSAANPSLKLTQVHNRDKLKSYYTDVLSYIYSRSEWYNGMPLSTAGDKFSQSGWMDDYVSRMIGVVRLRQKRVQSENCIPLLLRHLFPDWKCSPLLTDLTEDKKNYSLGWQNIESIYVDMWNPWKYNPLSDQSQTIYYGFSGISYSDGGYILNLGRTIKETKSILWKINEANWITKMTQAIFLDTSVYNPNIDMISIISVCLEFKQTIGVYRKVRILHINARYDFYTSETFLWIFLFMIFLLLLSNLFISMLHQGYAFFFSFWNIIDLGVVILFALNYAIGVINMLRTIFSIQNHLNTDQEGFFPYGWVEYHREKYKMMYILLAVLCNVKLFKHCMDTFKVAPILITLRLSGHHIFRIMILVLPMMYFQFSIIGSLLFNPQLIANQFTLVNKVGLKIYSQQFVFPEEKTVPYLYCQFSYLVILILGILIVYHYRIAKQTATTLSRRIDVIRTLRENLTRQGERDKPRLRGGAEANRSSLNSQRSMDVTCLVAIQTMFNCAADQECSLKRLKNFVNWKVNQDKEDHVRTREMAKVLENMDYKLDRIADNLKDILDNW